MGIQNIRVVNWPLWRPAATVMRGLRFPGKMLLISAAFLLPLLWLLGAPCCCSALAAQAALLWWWPWLTWRSCSAWRWAAACTARMRRTAAPRAAATASPPCRSWPPRRPAAPPAQALRTRPLPPAARWAAERSTAGRRWLAGSPASSPRGARWPATLCLAQMARTTMTCRPLIPRTPALQVH